MSDIQPPEPPGPLPLISRTRLWRNGWRGILTLSIVGMMLIAGTAYWVRQTRGSTPDANEAPLFH